MTDPQPQTPRYIAIAGRFDFSCHAEFRSRCASLTTGSAVTVDFATTTYIDSAALGMLLLLRDRVGDPQQISLINCHGQPDEVLRIANFHKLFRYTTQADRTDPQSSTRRQ